MVVPQTCLPLVDAYVLLSHLVSQLPELLLPKHLSLLVSFVPPSHHGVAVLVAFGVSNL